MNPVSAYDMASSAPPVLARSATYTRFSGAWPTNGCVPVAARRSSLTTGSRRWSLALYTYVPSARVTYTSISCLFLADGAVRRPSSRFTPHAAQSRFDRTWGGSFSVLNSRLDCRALRTCIKGLPPSVCGGGRTIGFRFGSGDVNVVPVVTN